MSNTGGPQSPGPEDLYWLGCSLLDSGEPGKAAGYLSRAAGQAPNTPAIMEKLADLIRSCGIDVPVDLNAYSTLERLPLFADRPAPVTAAWFNMYATSGLPGFDCIIGDHEVV